MNVEEYNIQSVRSRRSPSEFVLSVCDLSRQTSGGYEDDNSISQAVLAAWHKINPVLRINIPMPHALDPTEHIAGTKPTELIEQMEASYAT